MGLAVAGHRGSDPRQAVWPRRRTGHVWLLLLAQAETRNVGRGCCLWQHRRAGASALPARSARAAAGRVTRCRPHSRQPSQSPIRCGHDPAGLRSALCRDSVRNGYALSRCVAPRCRKPTHEPPICARSVPKAALARPLPTRQTRQKGRLNFLYPISASVGE